MPNTGSRSLKPAGSAQWVCTSRRWAGLYLPDDPNAAPLPALMALHRTVREFDGHAVLPVGRQWPLTLNAGPIYSPKGNFAGYRGALSDASEGATMGLHVAVGATGVGTSPVDLPHLFGPFNGFGHGRGTITGTRIGPVISRRRVQAMGGQLTTTSTLRVGITVSLCLPAAPSA